VGPRGGRRKRERTNGERSTRSGASLRFARMSEYVLGASRHELERLTLQQDVWGHVTERFLDRVTIEPGATAVDLGCGPGLVLPSLAGRVGAIGKVIAVDESKTWMAHLEEQKQRRNWVQVELRATRIEKLDLAPDSCDLIFARWVLSFLPRVGDLVARLARALKPGGVLAIEDYNHEGVSLFPESDGFRAAIRATRAWYASQGGDTWVAARLPGHMRAAGLELFDFTPNVLCGGPHSPAFRWADAFFPHHSSNMVSAGLMSTAERERFLAEWDERKANPDAVFFSPIVVDVAARKPLES
jgi:ubiquinone/menaquinone biosynthesis C-methylase UbiE